MRPDFDEIIDRSHTNSVKWDLVETIFGSSDILPMWVADMDFKSPTPVIEALIKRAEHGVYGYSEGMDSYYDAIIKWMRERHGWKVNKEWITFCPGVVSGLIWLVRALTNPGDKVVIQSPVYPPFFKAVEKNGCQVINNPLLLIDDRYVMDLDDLEQKFLNGAKLMILCSPHNPVGRVWRKEELSKLGELCLRYGVILISDEIHGDLVYPNSKHIPFASISEEFAENSIICTAPSKTFNLAGLQVSNIIISNPRLRQAFRKVLADNGISHPNVFGIVALEAAYNEGASWLDELMNYVEGNLYYLLRFVEERIPEIKVIKPEGTYLVWLDCRKLGMAGKALHDFLVKEAKVGLNAGFTFGEGGEGFMRINIACPKALLKEGLERIEKAIKG